MLRIYDQNKNPLGYIIKYKDLCIESDLSTGDKSLSFTYCARAKDIRNEYYIETKDDRFVVKEVGESTDGYPTFKCQLDLEDLEADMLDSFSSVGKSLTSAATLALAGTGWRVNTDITKLRNVATFRATPLTIIGKIRDAWMCENRYDTKNKIVYFRERFGEDKGVYFMPGLNLRKAELTNDSYDYYTRIIPIGKNGLQIDSINGGKAYVENYQYSNKVRTLIWEDTSYEDAATLKEDAERKLDDLSKPKKSYSADVIDLAAQSEKYSILSYSLGDTVLILDERSGIKDKQRIVKMKEYPQTPEKNSCELSNTTLSFEEYQARLAAAAAAFETVTNADGTVNGYYVHCVDKDGTVSVEVLIDGIKQDAQTSREEHEAGIKNLTEVTTTQSASINTMQGQIDALITADTTIKGDYNALISQYNSTVATVDSIKTTISEHTTLLDAQGESIVAVQTRTNIIESDLDGTKRTVSSIQNDLSDTNSAMSEIRTSAEQTAEKFEWIVKSGTSESDFTLTDRTAELIAETISLNGNVRVNGDMLVDGAITAVKLSADAIKSKNYAYSSGNYSDAGTFLDLSNGVIRSKNFGIDSSGNAYFKGKIEASNLSGCSIDGCIITGSLADVSSIISDIVDINGGLGMARSTDLYIPIDKKLHTILHLHDNGDGNTRLRFGTEDLPRMKIAVLNDMLCSGSISEGGTLLSDKYALKSTAEKALPGYSLVSNSYFSSPQVFRVQALGNNMCILEISVTTKAAIPAWTDVTIGQLSISPFYQAYVHAITDTGKSVRVVINTNRNVVIGTCLEAVGASNVIRCIIPFFKS